MSAQQKSLLLLKNISLLAIFLFSATVSALELNHLPNIDPGQIQRTLARETAEKFHTKQVTIPTVAPIIPQTGVQQGLGITFNLTKILLEGNTIYSHETLKSLYQPYLGKKLTLNELQKIADAITAKYRNDGYILSKAIIPPQRIKQGIVIIRIIEGYIEQTTVQGKTSKAIPLLEAYADRIIQQRPLSVKTLERYALLSNDIPGIEVKTVLKPSPITPGASDLTLLIQEAKPYNLFASFDNRGTRYSGPNQLFIGGNLNSFFRPGDRTSLTVAQTSRMQELQFLLLNYQTPIATNGANIEINVQNAYNQPGYTLKRLDIIGRSQELSLKLNSPLLRTRQHNLALITNFTSRDNFTDILATKMYRDHIRSLTVSLHYFGSDQWLGANNVKLDIEQGLDLLGASSAGSRFLSRPLAKPNYSKINVALSRLQSINNRFSLLAGITGQFSWDALPASEQFGFGGTDYGRAYDPFEISGDKGISGKTEIRYDMAINKPFLQTVQYYAYYDVGVVWNIDTASQQPRQSRASTGLGTRLMLTKNTMANLEMAKPLTYPVAALAPQGQGPRWFFSITWMK